MQAKIIIFIVMIVVVVSAAVFLVLFSTGAFRKTGQSTKQTNKKSKKKKDVIADDLKKKRYDTEEDKGEINTKSLTELLDGDDWRGAKSEAGDLKTDIVSEDLISEGNEKLKEALLSSESLNREKADTKSEEEESLGTGIFTMEERTGLLDQIIEEDSSSETEYHTQILLPDEQEYPQSTAESISAGDAAEEESEEVAEKYEEPSAANPKEAVTPKEETQIPVKAEAEEKVPERMDAEKEQPYFTGRAMSEKFTDLRFDGDNFEESVLVDSSITSSAFLDVKFTRPIFSKVLFKSVSFKYAEFKGAYFIGCTFKNCDFSKADFGDATIDDVKFIGCTFDEKTDVEKVSVKRAGFVAGTEKTDICGAAEFKEMVSKISGGDAL